MNRSFIRTALASATLLLAACSTELEQKQAMLQDIHNRVHLESCQENYHDHVKSLQRNFNELRDALGKTVQAEWSWSIECDACDESLLPEPVRLSKAELDTLKATLAQAEAMPPLPQESFMTPCPRLTFSDTGEILIPMPVMSGCCGGGVFCQLSLQDAAGNWLFFLSEEDFIPASRLEEWRLNKDDLRPELLLPDAAYAQFFALPATRKAMAADKALQKKLEQTHAPE